MQFNTVWIGRRFLFAFSSTFVFFFNTIVGARLKGLSLYCIAVRHVLCFHVSP